MNTSRVSVLPVGLMILIEVILKVLSLLRAYLYSRENNNNARLKKNDQFKENDNQQDG